jgi:ribosomal subunit interface protein
MRLPLQVTFKNIPPSDAIESQITEKAAKLDRFSERVMSCRVVVDSTQRRQHQGKLFVVRVDITVPRSRELVTSAQHEDVYVAIRDAFDSAYRVVEEKRRQERGMVKSHEEIPVGLIARIFPDERYGFIRTADERDIYFHGNSVLNDDFGRLKVGSEVSFLEEQGKEGPQAIRVAVRRVA